MSDKRTGVIYIATNLETGKQYVGQTINFKTRLRQHTYNLANTYFDNSLTNHGVEAFDFVQINYPAESLNYWEEFWIAKLKTMHPNGYNLTTGGEGRGKFSDEARRNMGESHKGEKSFWFGKHLSEEMREKIRRANIGKRLSDETKAKIGFKSLGRRQSKETIEKRVSHFRGKPRSQETRDRISKTRISKGSGRGIKQSPEWIAKRVSSHIGKHRSSGVRENISRGRLLMLAKRKMNEVSVGEI